MSSKKVASFDSIIVPTCMSDTSDFTIKNLIAPHPYRFTRGGVPEAYCPDLRCTPQAGMEKTKAAAQGSGGRRVCGLIPYRLGLARTLYIVQVRRIMGSAHVRVGNSPCP